MDKFVVRAPTWKKLTYTAAVDKAKKESVEPKKPKPLQEKQQRQLAISQQCNTYVAISTTTPGSRRRLSIRDEKLLQIFTARPDQPLMPTNEDSGLSSSSGNSLDSAPDTFQRTADENQPFVAAKANYLGELSDYVNCGQDVCTQQTLLITETTSNALSGVDINCANATAAPLNQQQLGPPPTTELTTATPNRQAYMVRIQQDLDSPSAATRMRALKALRNPASSAYTNFDVPHDEQSIITAEERAAIPPVPTIEELMNRIVVYVEVRSGEDNRSEGVKKVISLLGARVNDKLLRDTTHVIFKDGLLSTYKKAKHWNIPVVSILWIEACKNHRMICDPKDFPISNLDRYENPELYEKMKRQRSMQPDSECNKRIRIKHGTPKDSTPKTVTETLRKASTIIGDASVSGGKPKTDISQYFKKIANKASATAVDKDNAVTPIAASKSALIQKTLSMSNLNMDSPATQLLKRIDSNTFTPIMPLKRISETNILNDGDRERKISSSEVTLVPPTPTIIRKALDFGGNQAAAIDKPAEPPAATPIKHIMRRRSSMQISTECSTSECSLQITDTVTPRRTTRRRTSLAAAPMNTSVSTVFSNTPRTATCNQSKCNVIVEEKDGASSSEKTTAKHKMSPTSARKCKRRSTYTHKSLEISPDKQTKSAKEPRLGKSRRTLYTPQKMDETLSSDISWTKISRENKVLDEKLLQFALTPTTLATSDTDIPCANNKKTVCSLIEENSSSSNIFDSARPPNRRRTLFDVSMDIIQQRLHNINNSARLSMANIKSIETPPKAKTPLTKLDAILTPSTTTNSSSNVDGNDIRENSEIVPISTPVSNKNETINVETLSNGPPKSPIKSIKKRKLYVPNESVPVPTPPTKQATTTPRAKRRRTLMSPRSPEKRAHGKCRRSILGKNAQSKSRSDANVNSPSKELLNPSTRSEPSVAAQHKSSTNEIPTATSQLIPTQESTASASAKRQIATLAPPATLIEPMLLIKAAAPKTDSQLQRAQSPASAARTVTNVKNLPTDNQKNVGVNDGNEFKLIAIITENERSQKPVEERAAPPSKAPTIPRSTSTPRSAVVQVLSRPTSPSRQSISLLKATTAQCLPRAELSAASLPSRPKPPAPPSLTQQIPVRQIVKQLTKPLLPLSTPKLLPKPNVLKTDVVATASNKATTSTKPSKCPRGINVVEKKKWPYIVCTNMHREQIKVIRETIAAIGGFDLDHYVNNDTTHVVSYEPRRTLNLLRALIRGLWILEYKWVLDSLKAGEWLPEEEYELKDFSRAVEICRTERQAFGAMYKCELFTDLGPFYVSSRCGPISKANLKELIELCGGKIVDQRKRAKYILGDPNRALEDKVCVTPFWVLDSITQMQVMRIQKYTCISTTQRSPQPLILGSNATQSAHAVTSTASVHALLQQHRNTEQQQQQH